MMLRVVLFLCFACSVLKISAQESDPTRSLGVVEISADKVSVFSAGRKIETLDSAMLAVRQGISIATLLNEQSAVSIRSYGPGGISTLTLRGTNSTQSGVFWNGINLQQPNVGMTDLSRISTFGFSDITLQPGGSASLLGSGVIGGSLQLSNKIGFSSPLHTSVLLSAANMGNRTGGLKLSAGSSRLAYNGSLSGDWNNNNFWYTAYSGERQRLEHGLVKSVSTIHQAEYILNTRQRLTAGLWYQSTNRQIPPTMTMASSDQQQWDQALRSSLQWMYTGSNQSFLLRTSYIDEHEHFKSESALIDAFYHLETYRADFEYKRYLGKRFSLGSGASAQTTRADVTYYGGIKYQPLVSFWLALAYTDPHSGISGALNFRQDYSKGYNVPFCPSLSASIPVSKYLSASFSASGNYRIPTMNDKYWIPGGNPNLKTEISWNLEGGAKLKWQSGKLVKSVLDVSLYSLWIDNLIQWVPVSNGYWSPQNVQKVWSRGIEISSRSDLSYAGFNGYFRFGYTYSPSTYMKTSANQLEMLGKQLIYTPLHKIQETFYVSQKSFFSMFSITYTGKRFIQGDNQEWLASYSLFDIYTGVNLKTRKVNCRFQCEVHNVFNVEYQSVQYYPEPGRYYSVSLLISK